MTYLEAKSDLERNHIYATEVFDSEQAIVGLKVVGNPHYKDDRMIMMRGVLPKEFKIKWSAKESMIIVSKS